MTEKSKITTIDEAKAALDEEIEAAERNVGYAREAHTRAKDALEKAEGRLWPLKALRARMEPDAVQAMDGGVDRES